MSEAEVQTPIQRNFQAVMDERGLNYRSWAFKAGLPDSAVKAVMYTRSNFPRIDTLLRLAAAADVPLERLISGILPGVDAQISANVPYEIEDKEFFGLFREIDIDLKIAFLMLLRALTKKV